jgi:hypothetical protein
VGAAAGRAGAAAGRAGGGGGGGGGGSSSNTVELHLSGLIGTASQPEIQNIRIIGFFLEKSCIDNWKRKNLRTAVLGYVFIYLQIKH